MRARESSGEPNAITVIHSAWRKPRTAAAVGGRKSALAEVTSVVLTK